MVTIAQAFKKIKINEKLFFKGLLFLIWLVFN